MASLFSHLLVGATATKLASSVTDVSNKPKLYALAMFSSAMPDLDVIAFDFGIHYEHWLGHRGLTHSFAFAVVWSCLLVMLFYTSKFKFKQEALVAFIVIFISTVSHGIIDAMTNGGRGIGFFIPFDNARYFFPFRPIQVSPLGVDRFFSDWGMRVIKSELMWIGLPCLMIYLVCGLRARVCR